MNTSCTEEEAKSFPRQNIYYVIFVETLYQSFDDALARAPELITAHIARSKELHNRGTLFMAGAFLNRPQEPLSTMAVLRTRDAAEEYIQGDPFFLHGMVRTWEVREWANMFA